MTRIRHHPQGETLMSYAAGTLDPALSVVLDCHLQFCGKCRRALRTMDDLGGLLLEGLGALEDEAFLKRAMEGFAREAGQRPVPQKPSTPDPGNEAMMPAPLARATGLSRETIPWKKMPYGLMRFDLPAFPGALATAQILHIEPDAVLHSERHGGQLILVLWGAYTYDGERYERGDLHDITESGFKTFTSGSLEGVTFFTAISPVPQVNIIRTAH